MATALRLTRKGRKKKPFYHLVATDSRNKRDGAFIECIGYYSPLGDKPLHVEVAAAERWLACGAVASATVKKLLRRAGVAAAGGTPIVAEAAAAPATAAAAKA